THTVVETAAEGRGVGSALARTALDAARAEGLRVVPQCPFIAAYIARHPDYADLVVWGTPTAAARAPSAAVVSPGPAGDAAAAGRWAGRAPAGAGRRSR